MWDALTQNIAYVI